MNTSLQDAALSYAARGLRVLALVPGEKFPLKGLELQPHGCHSATTDPLIIRELWRRTPRANVGIATGAGSGVDIADYDGPHSPALAKSRGLIAPATWTVRTRRGFHLYVLHDDAVPSKASILIADCGCVVDGKPKPCALDTRGNGGLAVAPPSVVLGHVYGIERDLPFAAWPELYALCRSLTPPRPPPLKARTLPAGEGRIARIKAAWRVEELAEQLGAVLHGQGDRLRGQCPLHSERNGFAFVLWRGDQHWQCFGKCGIGGDVIDLFGAAQDRGLIA